MLTMLGYNAQLMAVFIIFVECWVDKCSNRIPERNVYVFWWRWGKCPFFPPINGLRCRFVVLTMKFALCRIIIWDLKRSRIFSQLRLKGTFSSFRRHRVIFIMEICISLNSTINCEWQSLEGSSLWGCCRENCPWRTIFWRFPVTGNQYSPLSHP